jgi:hypothetical protein
MGGRLKPLGRDLSFGQNGLDVWEGKLQVSFGF